MNIVQFKRDGKVLAEACFNPTHLRHALCSIDVDYDNTMSFFVNGELIQTPSLTLDEGDTIPVDITRIKEVKK